MRIRLKSWTAVFALGLLAASAAQASDTGNGEEKLAKLLDGRVAGQAIPCIETRKIITTELVQGAAIVYRLRGSDTLYVNRPTAGLEDLRAADGFETRNLPRLCQANLVMGLENNGRDRSPTYSGGAVLGAFVPYAKAP